MLHLVSTILPSIIDFEFYRICPDSEIIPFSYAFLPHLQVRSRWYILTILRVHSKRESARITITRIRDSRLAGGKSTKLLEKKKKKSEILRHQNLAQERAKQLRTSCLHCNKINQFLSMQHLKQNSAEKEMFSIWNFSL